ncbi:MAG: chromate transporter [Treponema sp.]|jgi:chromate transporter|nr:chromate transporter [Treponema sp.]
MNLFLLYIEFFRIGIFSVGGGLATLPFLYSMASRYDWLKSEDIGNFLAIAQSSPGAIGVNTSAQVGYLAGGFPGGILAALGLVSPAIVVIVAAAKILSTFKENTVVQAVFEGLRPAAAGLISAAGFGVIVLSLYSKDGFLQTGVWYGGIRWKEMILFAVIFLLVWKFKKHPILYITLAGMTGFILKL